MRFVPPLIVAWLLPSFAFADTTYELLAPIADLSTVTMTTYLEGMVRVVIGVAGILAVIMIVICGMKLIGSPSVSQKEESKGCIWNAVFGLLLAIGSWVILNTINSQLLSSSVEMADVGSAPAVTGNAVNESTPTKPGCYFKYRVVATDRVAYSRQDTCAMCETVRIQTMGEPELTKVESNCFQVPSGSGPTQVAATPPPAPPAGAIRCAQSGLDLSKPQFAACWGPNCQQFKALTNDPFILAIISRESSCGLKLVGDGGDSCGPLHMKSSTANKYREKCGLDKNVPIQCGFLADKANWSKAICLSQEFIKEIKNSPCGDKIQNVAAGYNGGIGACSPSANCSGLMRWECLYDDNARQVCNNGYVSTRNYATQVLYCTQNPMP